jgi:hypothetical protein
MEAQPRVGFLVSHQLMWIKPLKRKPVHRAGDREAEDRPGDRQWFACTIIDEARGWAATPHEATD